MEGLLENAGKFRVRDVVIDGSQHLPPPWHEVPAHIKNLCEYVDQGGRYGPLNLAAYVLWFINWVHPFDDGNGRVARAATYIVLSVALGQEIWGEVTLIERLVTQKIQYWRRLESADRAFKKGKEDVSELQELLTILLVEQLTDPPGA